MRRNVTIGKERRRRRKTRLSNRRGITDVGVGGGSARAAAPRAGGIVEVLVAVAIVVGRVRLTAPVAGGLASGGRRVEKGFGEFRAESEVFIFAGSARRLGEVVGVVVGLVEGVDRLGHRIPATAAFAGDRRRLAPIQRLAVSPSSARTRAATNAAQATVC